MLRRTLLTGGATALAGACTPSLGTFNRLAPRDGGARRLRADAAYGAGARQRLDLYGPETPPEQPVPILVFIYGGSWRSGAKEEYGFVGDAFAARGFLTAIPDYRIAPDVFPTFLEDCAAAVAWVGAHAADYGGDPGRIVLAGHSAGAYNAVMLGLDRSYLDAAGAPTGAIRGVAGIAGPYDFYPYDVEATRFSFGGAPDPARTQPIHFARADAPPFLLLWGADDTTVGPRNIASLDRAMRAAGGRVEAKTYPGVDHIEIMLALSRPFRNRAPVLDDVATFARRVQ
jgi:acetyl esterase/lipase